MKKRLSLRLSALLLCLLLLLGSVSCGKEAHTHTYGEWVTDAQTHSRTCAGCAEAESGSHSFAEVPQEDGTVYKVCSVCGYRELLYAVVLDEFDEWDIHTQEQADYLAGDPANVPSYLTGKQEKSLPESLEYTWNVPSLTDESTLAYYRFSISENPDMTGAAVSSTAMPSFSVTRGGQNLKVRTVYYWQVDAVLTDGTELHSKISSFTTLSGPRNMYVAGVTNFRDLGGWDCAGGVVKQGLLYRGGRLHGQYSPSLKISAKGIQTMLDLGIKSEIDLRGIYNSAGVCENGTKKDGSFVFSASVLGPTVAYYNPGGEYTHTGFIDEQGKRMLKGAFDVLCDPACYPAYFHCSIGTDRTGLVGVLVLSVLGCSEHDIMQDYLFSDFGNIEDQRDVNRYNTFMKYLKDFEGDTLMVKAENCLKNMGIIQEQIDSLRNILIEKK